MHLNVYFHEQKAGSLFQDNIGRLSFQYDENYILKNGASISITMPLRIEIYSDEITTPFFSSLLPDETLRTRLAKNIGTSEENIFALLKEVGRECAGAISLYPPDENPDFEKKPKLISIQEDHLATILDELKQRPLLRGPTMEPSEEGLRLSLAGAQTKLAVGILSNQIVLITEGSPTTHILKLENPDYSEMVENEFFCMKLSALMDIPTAQVEIRHAKEKTYLAIKRYDRIWSSKEKKIMRLHQEDFCQALAIPPQKKYERDGGPGFKQCLELIRKYSGRPAIDQRHFIFTCIFNYFIGNADAHGKNFSLVYTASGIMLAPAYDLICTAAYPQLAKNMAMKLGGYYDPEIIVRRHWSELMPANKSSQNQLDIWLNYFATVLPVEAKRLKDQLSKSEITSSVFDKIIHVIETRTSHYLASFQMN